MKSEGFGVNGKCVQTLALVLYTPLLAMIRRRAGQASRSLILLGARRHGLVGLNHLLKGAQQLRYCYLPNAQRRLTSAFQFASRGATLLELDENCYLTFSSTVSSDQEKSFTGKAFENRPTYFENSFYVSIFLIPCK